jgi:diguanylate cyclase (GGDEF)-like protein/PAS domain S-box-containing protein
MDARTLELPPQPAEVDGGALYRSMIEDLHDGVYVVDLERQVTVWNRAAETISGYGKAEVMGRRCRDNLLVHTDGEGLPLCSTGCPLEAVLRDGVPRQADVYLKHKMGHRVPVSVRAAPLRSSSGEIVGVVESFNENSAKMEALEKVRELEHLALIDVLTGLGNRRFAQRSIAEAMATLDRAGTPFGLIFCDVDNFKGLNDRFGHAAGDAVLRMVARTLENGMRSVDFLARWGGDEFVALLPRIDSVSLRRVAERLLRLVRESNMEWDGARLAVTLSAGAVLVQSGDTPEGLLHRADEGLYAAKDAGRDRVVGPWTC